MSLFHPLIPFALCIVFCVFPLSCKPVGVLSFVPLRVCFVNPFRFLVIFRVLLNYASLLSLKKL